jgi:hypothetical protein
LGAGVGVLFAVGAGVGERLGVGIGVDVGGGDGVCAAATIGGVGGVFSTAVFLQPQSATAKTNRPIMETTRLFIFQPHPINSIVLL